MSSIRAKALSVAALQHHAISFRQAMAIGVDRRVPGREWRKLLPGVYATEAGGFEQECTAALLWAGPRAVISHGSAARIWGLDGTDRLPIELTVPKGVRPRADIVTVHRADLRREDWCERGGIRVTRIGRTLIDLATTFEPLPLAIALESAWRQHLLHPNWLSEDISRRGINGRKGLDTLQELVADCATRARPMESVLEVRLWHYLRASGLPLPRSQCPFEEFRIDFAYPVQRLAIEADGFETHGKPKAFEPDRIRLSRLTAAGWRVMHVTWKQLKRPERVLEQIRAALNA